MTIYRYLIGRGNICCCYPTTKGVSLFCYELYSFCRERVGDKIEKVNVNFTKLFTTKADV